MGERAREGCNIKRMGLLNENEKKLWEEAMPYIDKRDDAGQAELVSYFTIELMKFFHAIREVVLPAAMLHDVGFYGIDPRDWKNLVRKGKTNGELARRPHQNRGILLVGKLFERVGYPFEEKYQMEVAEIIGDHDTRKLPTSESGRVMRAADLLWRVTYPCIETYHSGKSVESLIEISEKNSLEMRHPYSLNDIAKNMGRIELVNSLFWKFKKKSFGALSEKYGPELEKIRKMYDD